MPMLVFFELKYIIPLSKVYSIFGPIQIYFILGTGYNFLSANQYTSQTKRNYCELLV